MSIKNKILFLLMMKINLIKIGYLLLGGRDKSRLGLRNFKKPDFWMPFIRESVAKLRFVPDSITEFPM